MAAGDEQDLIEAVVTCEGNLHDPDFQDKFRALVDKLKSALYISKTKDPFRVRKIEPWNSVRVTISIPKEAAQKLKLLAQQGSNVLRSMGILSVQVEGDQVISLTWAAQNSEPTQVILRQTSDESAGSSGTSGVSSLSLPASSPSVSSISSSVASISSPVSLTPGTSGDTSGMAVTLDMLSSSSSSSTSAFRSPNVVAPSGEAIPVLPPKTPATSVRPALGGPFPFVSMTHAAQAIQRSELSPLLNSNNTGVSNNISSSNAANSTNSIASSVPSSSSVLQGSSKSLQPSQSNTPMTVTTAPKTASATLTSAAAGNVSTSVCNVVTTVNVNSESQVTRLIIENTSGLNSTTQVVGNSVASLGISGSSNVALSQAGPSQSLQLQFVNVPPPYPGVNTVSSNHSLSSSTSSSANHNILSSNVQSRQLQTPLTSNAAPTTPFPPTPSASSVTMVNPVSSPHAVAGRGSGYVSDMPSVAPVINMSDSGPGAPSLTHPVSSPLLVNLLQNNDIIPGSASANPNTDPSYNQQHQQPGNSQTATGGGDNVQQTRYLLQQQQRKPKRGLSLDGASPVPKVVPVGVSSGKVGDADTILPVTQPNQQLNASSKSFQFALPLHSESSSATTMNRVPSLSQNKAASSAPSQTSHEQSLTGRTIAQGNIRLLEQGSGAGQVRTIPLQQQPPPPYSTNPSSSMMSLHQGKTGLGTTVSQSQLSVGSEQVTAMANGPILSPSLSQPQKGGSSISESSSSSSSDTKSQNLTSVTFVQSNEQQQGRERDASSRTPQTASLAADQSRTLLPITTVNIVSKSPSKHSSNVNNSNKDSDSKTFIPPPDPRLSSQVQKLSHSSNSVSSKNSATSNMVVQTTSYNSDAKSSASHPAGRAPIVSKRSSKDKTFQPGQIASPGKPRQFLINPLTGHLEPMPQESIISEIEEGDDGSSEGEAGRKSNSVKGSLHKNKFNRGVNLPPGIQHRQIVTTTETGITVARVVKASVGDSNLAQTNVDLEGKKQTSQLQIKGTPTINPADPGNTSNVAYGSSMSVSKKPRDETLTTAALHNQKDSKDNNNPNPSPATVTATSVTGEKIKLRLKLEKSEPISPAYKVDVKFLKKSEKSSTLPSSSASASSANSASTTSGAGGSQSSGDQPRVPPLHISLRGKNAAVVVSPRREEKDNMPPPVSSISGGKDSTGSSNKDMSMTESFSSSQLPHHSKHSSALLNSHESKGSSGSKSSGSTKKTKSKVKKLELVPNAKDKVLSSGGSEKNKTKLSRPKLNKEVNNASRQSKPTPTVDDDKERVTMPVLQPAVVLPAAKPETSKNDNTHTVSVDKQKHTAVPTVKVDELPTEKSASLVTNHSTETPRRKESLTPSSSSLLPPPQSSTSSGPKIPASAPDLSLSTEQSCHQSIEKTADSPAVTKVQLASEELPKESNSPAAPTDTKIPPAPMQDSTPSQNVVAAESAKLTEIASSSQSLPDKDQLPQPQVDEVIKGAFSSGNSLSVPVESLESSPKSTPKHNDNSTQPTPSQLDTSATSESFVHSVINLSTDSCDINTNTSSESQNVNTEKEEEKTGFENTLIPPTMESPADKVQEVGVSGATSMEIDDQLVESAVNHDAARKPAVPAVVVDASSSSTTISQAQDLEPVDENKHHKNESTDISTTSASTEHLSINVPEKENVEIPEPVDPIETLKDGKAAVVENVNAPTPTTLSGSDATHGNTYKETVTFDTSDMGNVELCEDPKEQVKDEETVVVEKVNVESPKTQNKEEPCEDSKSLSNEGLTKSVEAKDTNVSLNSDDDGPKDAENGNEKKDLPALVNLEQPVKAPQVEAESTKSQESEPEPRKENSEPLPPPTTQEMDTGKPTPLSQPQKKEADGKAETTEKVESVVSVQEPSMEQVESVATLPNTENHQHEDDSDTLLAESNSETEKIDSGSESVPTVDNIALPEPTPVMEELIQEKDKPAAVVPILPIQSSVSESISETVTDVSESISTTHEDSTQIEDSNLLKPTVEIEPTPITSVPEEKPVESAESVKGPEQPECQNIPIPTDISQSSSISEQKETPKECDSQLEIKADKIVEMSAPVSTQSSEPSVAEGPAPNNSEEKTDEQLVQPSAASSKTEIEGVKELPIIKETVPQKLDLQPEQPTDKNKPEPPLADTKQTETSVSAATRDLPSEEAKPSEKSVPPEVKVADAPKLPSSADKKKTNASLPSVQSTKPSATRTAPVAQPKASTEEKGSSKTSTATQEEKQDIPVSVAPPSPPAPVSPVTPVLQKPIVLKVDKKSSGIPSAEKTEDVIESSSNTTSKVVTEQIAAPVSVTIMTPKTPEVAAVTTTNTPPISIVLPSDSVLRVSNPDGKVVTSKNSYKRRAEIKPGALQNTLKRLHDNLPKVLKTSENQDAISQSKKILTSSDADGVVETPVNKVEATTVVQSVVPVSISVPVTGSLSKPVAAFTTVAQPHPQTMNIAVSQVRPVPNVLQRSKTSTSTGPPTFHHVPRPTGLPPNLLANMAAVTSAALTAGTSISVATSSGTGQPQTVFAIHQNVSLPANFAGHKMVPIKLVTLPKQSGGQLQTIPLSNATPNRSSPNLLEAVNIVANAGSRSSSPKTTLIGNTVHQQTPINLSSVSLGSNLHFVPISVSSGTGTTSNVKVLMAQPIKMQQAGMPQQSMIVKSVLMGSNQPKTIKLIRPASMQEPIQFQTLIKPIPESSAGIEASKPKSVVAESSSTKSDFSLPTDSLFKKLDGVEILDTGSPLNNDDLPFEADIIHDEKDLADVLAAEAKNESNAVENCTNLHVDTKSGNDKGSVKSSAVVAQGGASAVQNHVGSKKLLQVSRGAVATNNPPVTQSPITPTPTVGIATPLLSYSSNMKNAGDKPASRSSSPTDQNTPDLHGEDEEIIKSFSKTELKGSTIGSNDTKTSTTSEILPDHTYGITPTALNLTNCDSGTNLVQELSIEIPPNDLESSSLSPSQNPPEEKRCTRSTRSNTRLSPDITAFMSDAPKTSKLSVKGDSLTLRNSPKPSPTGSLKVLSPTPSSLTITPSTSTRSSPILHNQHQINANNAAATINAVALGIIDKIQGNATAQNAKNSRISKLSGANKRKRQESDSSSASRDENLEEKAEIDLNSRPGKRKCSENAAEMIKVCIGVEDSPKRNSSIVKKTEDPKTRDGKGKRTLTSTAEEDDDADSEVSLTRGRSGRSSRESSEDRSSSRGSSAQRAVTTSNEKPKVTKEEETPKDVKTTRVNNRVGKDGANSKNASGRANPQQSPAPTKKANEPTKATKRRISRPNAKRKSPLTPAKTRTNVRKDVATAQAPAEKSATPTPSAANPEGESARRKTRSSAAGKRHAP